MLYVFKSPAAADLIMLEPNGRRMLQIIGKDAGPKGIIQVDQMPAAITAIEAQIAGEEGKKPAGDDASTDDEHKGAMVSLRQRAVPFIDMLKRCSAAGKDIVWGV